MKILNFFLLIDINRIRPSKYCVCSAKNSEIKIKMHTRNKHFVKIRLWICPYSYHPKRFLSGLQKQIFSLFMFVKN